MAARYALCTVIDEAVLNTPWGAQSDWAGQSLLVTFHRESGGGDKFFRVLERVIGEPASLRGAARAAARVSRARLRRPVSARRARAGAARRSAPEPLSRYSDRARLRRGRSVAALARCRRSTQPGRASRAALGGRGRVRCSCCSARSCSIVRGSGSVPDPINATLANVGLQPLFAARARGASTSSESQTLLAAPDLAGIAGRR